MNTWKGSFKDNVSLYNAYKMAVQDLKKAKEYSQINDFKYRVQMEQVNIMKGVI
jgi:hypothetical protein